MLNRLLSVLLLVALLGSCFSRYIVCAGFEANQSYIAKVLCENKSRPWLHCNGHCYLMKKLKEAGDKEKKRDQEEKRNQYQEGLPQKTTLTLAFFASPVCRFYSMPTIPEIVNRSSSIFQPPQVIS